MIDSYKLFWTKAFDFKGVSTRSQFWWAYLANTIVFVILYILFFIGFAINDILGSLLYILYIGYAFGQVIPFISISIRRTRDMGKGWPWIFINLVLCLGTIFYIYLLCQPSIPNA